MRRLLTVFASLCLLPSLTGCFASRPLTPPVKVVEVVTTKYVPIPDEYTEPLCVGINLSAAKDWSEFTKLSVALYECVHQSNYQKSLIRDIK